MAQAKKSTKNYQTLNDELQLTISDMQREDMDIDKAIQLYDRGLQIIKELETYLLTAENKINELKAHSIT